MDTITYFLWQLKSLPEDKILSAGDVIRMLEESMRKEEEFNEQVWEEEKV